MGFGISGGYSKGSETQTSTLDELVKQAFSQLTNQASSSTGTTSQSGTTTGQTEGSTERVLSPEQQAAQPMLFKIISALSRNPAQFLAPAQNQAREQVNENYTGLGDSLRQQFLTGGGGGGTGKYGRALLGADLARRGDLSRVDNEFAVRSATLPLTAAQLAQDFLGLNFGQRSTGRTDTTSTGATTTDERTDSTISTTGQTTTDRTQNQTARNKRSGWNLGGSGAFKFGAGA